MSTNSSPIRFVLFVSKEGIGQVKPIGTINTIRVGFPSESLGTEPTQAEKDADNANRRAQIRRLGRAAAITKVAWKTQDGVIVLPSAWPQQDVDGGLLFDGPMGSRHLVYSRIHVVDGDGTCKTIARKGNEYAGDEVICPDQLGQSDFERYCPPIAGFCKHVLAETMFRGGVFEIAAGFVDLLKSEYISEYAMLTGNQQVFNAHKAQIILNAKVRQANREQYLLERAAQAQLEGTA